MPDNDILQRPAITQPAATAPVIQITPQTGAPMRSSVEEASEAARARLASTGTALPTPPAIGQPRTQTGQFTQSTVKELPTPTDPAAPQVGRTAVTPPVRVPGVDDRPGEVPALEGPEGQETPAAEAAEGEQPPEGEEQPPEGSQEAAADDLTVLLPGREGDEEYEFVVESPEAADRLRQLKNGYMRGNAVREAEADIQAKLSEVENVRQSVTFDPAGFVAEILQTDPEFGAQQAEHLVLYLLTQPDLYKRVGPKVAKLLSDPNEFRVVAAEQKAARLDARVEMQSRVEQDRAVRQNLSEIQATVGAMLPPNLPPEQQQVAYSDMLRDLKEYADRHDLQVIPVHEIPTLLARRLTALGVNPVEAATRAAQAAQHNATTAVRHRSPGAIRPAAPTPAAPPAAPAAPPKPNGKRFVASATKRREASVPPAGAGSPGPGTLGGFTARKADGTVMSTEEAIAAHRARLAKGVRTY